ncbi:sensor histidine kinase [Neptunicella marina]|uniref:histidine kinase n=1 Tax=Neptunicella marina TaxID=2125989 RepID=A0A8J6IRG6_9ALTE|nr:HAMP domain-containing sensor histidine kinase [Neptunicella marina]MBC3764445.1 HAMP domain-containing histidine kinase [Neptunicella marina]
MLDFSSVLASAVHDMKNSLCLLLQSIETLSTEVADMDDSVSEQLASIHYEASRLNTSLMHILSLYRAGREQLPINIDEYYMDDLIDEVVATNQMYIDRKKMALNITLQDDLSWYLDNELVCLLLNDILINAIRYSKKNIAISVYTDNNQLCIQVEDDGNGYPQSMLDANASEMQDFDLSTGRTGLGLYFARMIAMSHERNGIQGSIEMENGGYYGGSVFRLKLP